MKTKLFLCLTIAFLFAQCLPLYAQEWASTYGGTAYDYAWAVQQTSDGGYIVAGGTESFGEGNGDIWIMKLDASGDISWQKTYGAADFDDVYAVQQTSDGGYIVAGNTKSFPSGDSNMWVLKLDASGDISWQKTYGGTDYDEADTVQQTFDGGYIVAGQTYSFGAGNSDMWVLKLNAAGDISWQKTYGGTDYDDAWNVQQTSDGGYIVAGETESFPSGDSNMWVLKLDAAGDISWQRTYGGADVDYANAVRQTSDGGYIVAGETKSFGAGDSDMWVLKLDESGNINGCSAIGTSDATVADTTSTINTTTSAVATTPVTPQSSSATVDITSVVKAQVCYAEAPVIPLPPGQESFTYAASDSPVFGEDPSQIHPVAVGTVATGGDILRLQVGIYKFTSPVDIYLLFSLSTDPNAYYMVTAGNSAQVFAGELIPWKQNVVSAVSEALFGEVPRSLLPTAVYNVYLGVTPAGGTGLEKYYVWATSFSVN